MTGVAALTRVDRADAWQTGQVQREFATVLAEATERSDTALRLTDVRALLGGHLAGRPTRANFRTGTLTVCTMVPMRNVPHRVVCLLGLDDGVFPRLGMVDGDDVLARGPITGERDIRSEDRQLLLDAVGAATEKLVITYTGANEHSGQPRPPAVPLGELLDVLDRTTPEPVRSRLVVAHPLQPFDVKNVTPGGLGVPTPFTFDPAMLLTAQTAAGDRPAAPEFLPSPLPEQDRADLSLVDLLGFFRDPVKGFFRALDLTLPWDVEGVSDAMPVEIDALETWGVGDRMLGDMLRGIHPDQALAAEWRRGSLPPGQLGWRKATEVREQAMQLAIAALTHRQVAPRAHDIDVHLGGGRRLTGTVTPVYGDRLVAVGYSRLDGKQLLESWIRLLALAAHQPDHNWTALTIGRAARGTNPVQRLLGPAGRGPGGAVARPGRALRRGAPRAAAAAAEDVVRLGQCPASGRQPARRRPEEVEERQLPRRGRRTRARAGLGSARPPGQAAHPGAGRGRARGRADPARGARGPVVAAAAALRTDGDLMKAFDLLGPLPSGPCTTVLEASAGTGKTFTLAGLVTRYVAEGVAGLDEMLLITFGRAASQELRERVRRQLVDAAAAFDDPDSVGDNELLRHLVTGTDDELTERRHRLRDALSRFDAATIATTHQFCQLVLRSLGVAGDTDAGVTLVESLDDLVTEIVDDLYLQQFGQEKETRSSPAGRRCRWPVRWSPTRATDAARRPTRRPGARRPSGSASPGPCSSSWSGASGGWASWATTTC